MLTTPNKRSFYTYCGKCSEKVMVRFLPNLEKLYLCKIDRKYRR